MHCDGCQFKSTQCSTPPIVEGKGGLAIVLESGSPLGGLLTGPAGEVLTKTLASVGLVDLSKVFITSSLLCCPPSGAADSMENIEACKPRLGRELRERKPDIILALGNTPLHAITGNYKLKITKEQGKVYQTEYGLMIPAIHPALILRSPNTYKAFRSTLAYVVKLANGHKVKDPGDTRYSLVTYEKSAHVVSKLIGLPKGHVFAVDVETTGFNPRKDKILYLGISWDKNKTLIFKGKHVSILQALFSDEDKEFVWHNGKFDAEFLHNAGINVRVDHDTMLQHYALNEIKGTHDLEQLAVNELGADAYEHELKPYLGKGKNYGDIPENVLLPYLAKDCDYTRQLHFILKAQVEKSKDLTLLYDKVLMPASRFLQRVERTGVYVDIPKITVLKTRLEQEQSETRKKIEVITAKVWNPKEYLRDTGAKTAPEKFNPGSPLQLKWLLYHKLKLKPGPKMSKDTREDTLLSIRPKTNLVNEIMVLRGIEKRLSTYVNGILNQLEDDGKVHASYLIHGTVTGRLSSREPNMQNIPRDPEVRDIFRATPGYYFIEADYRGAELRALAYFSQDPFLLRVFAEGRDLHTEVAIAMYGKNFTKDQRVRAKAVNFGLAYGRGAPSLAHEFNISVQEAQRMINAWFNRMPKAHAYLQRVRNAVPKGQVLKTPLGRMRRFGLVTHKHMYSMQNEAANFAISSTASDMTLLSAIRMAPLLSGLKARIVNLVHDSILIEVPYGDSTQSQATKIIVATMMDTPRRLLGDSVAFEVELNTGINWGSLKELKIITATDSALSHLVNRASS